MSNKTIAKFFLFVILTASLSLFGQGCATVKTGDSLSAKAQRFTAPEITGKIRSPRVLESSGIAASRCQNDVFWTHNDSGHEPYIYAFNRSGDDLGTWLVENTENRDWEDIASWKDVSGKCFIYIGETGDNKRLWSQHAIIRVPEPLVTASGSGNRETATLQGDTIRYTYPDGRHDAEALMVHPRSGDILLLTKNESGPSSVFRLKGDFGTATDQTAAKVGELSLPSVPNGMITGGDISPDARRMVVCDYRQAYEFELPEPSSDFDQIWKQKPDVLNIGKRKTGESICYSVDGSEIFATSEGKHPPIISIRRQN